MEFALYKFIIIIIYQLTEPYAINADKYKQFDAQNKMQFNPPH